MRRKLKVLYVAAELSPYASAGGLGEVGNGFPKALLEAGNVEVQRVIPLYRSVHSSLKYVADYPVQMERGYESCILKKDPGNKEIVTYFIQNDRYFNRDKIYAYEDDGFRFYFFCKAVIEMLKVISFKPDIVHCNDWHTGFLPLLLKKEFPDIKSVYTIHNISYHGFIPASYLEGILTASELQQLGYPEWLNFMKAGIIYSDLLTTVSPGYAKEILHPALSCGMSEQLEEREHKCIGILNGIDRKLYDPKQDPDIAYNYDCSNPEKKKENRSLLRAVYGLPDLDIPLIAMVTRLDYTKGLDLLVKAISYMDFNKLQLMILGSGNPYYQGLLADIASAYPGKIAVEFEYSPALARRIYAAADIYLMPSLSEPCGLGQLYAMRYGAVPVVNPVGGLKDTVCYCKDRIEESSGFYMEEWSGEALAKTVKLALDVYHTSKWRNIMTNAMNYDSSWERTVSEYMAYYMNIIQ